MPNQWSRSLEKSLRRSVQRLAVRTGHTVLRAISWSFHLNLPPQVSPASGRTADPTPKVNLSQMPDADLVTLCLSRGAKDSRPFSELFRRYQHHVWRTCYSFVRNSHDAEDLTQEVFFKVYRSLAQFEGRSSFKTWLHRIAINVSQNELRRRLRRPQETETAVESLAEVLPAEDTPETVLSSTSRRDHLSEALAALSPDEYEVLQLKDLELRPYREIVQILDISLSAAKMRVQRARLALMTAYGKLPDNS